MIHKPPHTIFALTTGMVFSFVSNTWAMPTQANLTSSSDPTVQIAQARQTQAILTAEPGSEINVRSGAGTTFSALHYGLPGDAVVILESNGTRGSIDPIWYRVRFVESQAEGWARGDFVLTGMQEAIAASCHEEIAKARTRISDVDNAYLVRVSTGVTNSPYSDRPNNLSLVLGGSGRSTVMASPQFMLNISTKLIDACETLGSVTFYTAAASGWHDVFGLVDGVVTQFSCADLSSSRPRMRWGEMNCDA